MMPVLPPLEHLVHQVTFVILQQLVMPPPVCASILVSMHVVLMLLLIVFNNVTQLLVSASLLLDKFVPQLPLLPQPPQRLPLLPNLLFSQERHFHQQGSPLKLLPNLLPQLLPLLQPKIVVLAPIPLVSLEFVLPPKFASSLQSIVKSLPNNKEPALFPPVVMIKETAVKLLQLIVLPSPLNLVKL
jgi:hypothetical protein